MSFSEAVAQRGIQSPYDGAIATAASAYGVDPALIKAIISQESNWSPTAYRAEPRINDASYGLMQVLLATARATSSNPSLTAAQLLIPEINLDIGSKFLAAQLTRFGYPDGISAYNAGRPISGNQLSYVEPVLAYQTWFQANDPLFGNPPVPLPSTDGGGFVDWIGSLFGTTETPIAEPLIDPVTGDVIQNIDPATGEVLPSGSTDLLAGVGIGVLLLGAGALWLLTRD
jgi:hypothetical protein